MASSISSLIEHQPSRAPHFVVPEKSVSSLYSCRSIRHFLSIEHHEFKTTCIRELRVHQFDLVYFLSLFPYRYS